MDGTPLGRNSNRNIRRVDDAEGDAHNAAMEEQDSTNRKRAREPTPPGEADVPDTRPGPPKKRAREPVNPVLDRQVAIVDGEELGAVELNQAERDEFGYDPAARRFGPQQPNVDPLTGNVRYEPVPAPFNPMWAAALALLFVLGVVYFKRR